MDERIEKIEEQLREIKKRNVRVEADKAWERSWLRVLSVLFITFIIASIVFYQIGNEDPLRNALIPTVAFYLSIQSLPFLKRKWVRSYLSKRSD